MKKIYKVFEGTDKNGIHYYFAAHHLRPWCPIFGSIGTKAKAKQAAADRMCLSVKEYNSLPVA